MILDEISEEARKLNQACQGYGSMMYSPVGPYDVQQILDYISKLAALVGELAEAVKKENQ
jgi:uncharacterized protein YukE